MSRYVSDRNPAPLSSSIDDPSVVRSMALHFLYRLRSDLRGCPPNSPHRVWIRDKIAHYEHVLRVLNDERMAS